MMTEQEVTVSIEVAADPPLAFDVFTAQIDSWWRRGPKHRFAPPWTGTLRFEPGAHGRLIEQYEDGTSYVIGRVRVWQPGERIILSWRLPSFAEAESTEVDVRFEPVDGGTRVSVVHRGWHALRLDHPARHGLTGRAFEYAKAGLWAENFNELRSYIECQNNQRMESRKS
jgi:hypothetical protein